MSDLNAILNGIIRVGETALPLLGPQGAAASAAIAAIGDLVAQAKGVANPAQAQSLEDLQAQVNAHAARTLGNLQTGG